MQVILPNENMELLKPVLLAEAETNGEISSEAVVQVYGKQALQILYITLQSEVNFIGLEGEPQISVWVGFTANQKEISSCMYVYLPKWNWVLWSSVLKVIDIFAGVTRIRISSITIWDTEGEIFPPPNSIRLNDIN